ncbi:MAG: hypothetical protein J3K34DRAFT_517145 [Monoraphidium minutum]|nr:MAG: hypothetical protein J3K34DRAFT_517145 [Monoraphidium minutum]
MLSAFRLATIVNDLGSLARASPLSLLRPSRCLPGPAVAVTPLSPRGGTRQPRQRCRSRPPAAGHWWPSLLSPASQEDSASSRAAQRPRRLHQPEQPPLAGAFSAQRHRRPAAGRPHHEEGRAHGGRAAVSLIPSRAAALPAGGDRPRAMVMDALAGLEELGFTEVPDALASPSLLSSPDSYSHDCASGGSDDSRGGGRRGTPPAGGWPAGAAGGPPAAEGCSVYVSNLAYAVSRAALVRLFAGCGDVRRVSIPLDPAGRPQGHAYVEFGSPHEAQAALNVAGAQMGGRPLRVSLKRSGAKPGAPPGGGPPQHRASEPGSGRHAAAGLQPSGGRAPRGGAPPAPRGRAGGAPRGRGVSDDASYSAHAPHGHHAPPRGGAHPYAKGAAAAYGGGAAAAVAHHGLYAHAPHHGGYDGHYGDGHGHALAHGGGGSAGHYGGGYGGYDARGGYYHDYPPHDGRQHAHHAMY